MLKSIIFIISLCVITTLVGQYPLKIPHIPYPQEAQEQKIEDTVLLRVFFDEKGNYAKHEVLEEGHPLLLKAVEDSIPLIKCTPETGFPYPVKYILKIPFCFYIHSPNEVYCLNFDEIREKIGYPEKAKNEGIKGKVVVSIKADKKGTVTTYKIIESSHFYFTKAVEPYLKELKFNPLYKNDVPIQINTSLTFEFGITTK